MYSILQKRFSWIFCASQLKKCLTPNPAFSACMMYDDNSRNLIGVDHLEMQQNSHRPVVLALKRMHSGRSTFYPSDRPSKRLREPRYPSSSSRASAKRQAHRVLRKEQGDACTPTLVLDHFECNHLPALQAVYPVPERSSRTEERGYGGSEPLLDAQRPRCDVSSLFFAHPATRARRWFPRFPITSSSPPSPPRLPPNTRSETPGWKRRCARRWRKSSTGFPR